ncbi:MAG: ABC transporter permease [Bdellovibrionota bacterium]|nr:ABC transporter permease [Bdellovibrionota bacterium]
MKEQKSKSLWYDSWRRLKKNKAAVVSAVFLMIVCFCAYFADWIAPYSFEAQDASKILLSPGAEHWLGTDSLGRDLLSRIIYGAQMSMAVGIFTSLASLVMGVIYGAISGWFGGRVDSIMMRFIDILYTIPALVLLILVMVLFNSLATELDPKDKALYGTFVALSIVGWVNIARLVRGQVLQEKQMLYVEAAVSIGVPSHQILTKHILPNILGPIIVTLTFQIPANVMFESFLSFIGLGIQPPYASWGTLAADGWRSLRTYPHIIISPGVILFLSMLAFNLLGDGLRDAFDPKARK